MKVVLLFALVSFAASDPHLPDDLFEGLHDGIRDLAGGVADTIDDFVELLDDGSNRRRDEGRRPIFLRNDPDEREDFSPADGHETTQYEDHRPPPFRLRPVNPHRPFFGGFNGFGGFGGFSPFLDMFNDKVDRVDNMTPFYESGFTSRQQPWYKGPNVCEFMEEDEEGSEVNTKFNSSGIFFHTSSKFSSCKDEPDRYVCTTIERLNGVKRTYRKIRKCCFGFERLEGEFGCRKVNLVDLSGTIGILGGTQFLDSLSDAMKEKLATGNYTVFLPSNEAMIDYYEEQETQNLLAGEVLKTTSTESLNDVLLNHLTQTDGGFTRTPDYTDNQILSSESGNSSIRINVFNGGHLITANCVPLSSKDNMATGGVVHVVDDVLTPVKHTIADILAHDKQFETFNTFLEEFGMFDRLDETNEGPLTVFAPTNTAFDATMLKLLKDGSACLQNILEHHVIPEVICSRTVNPHVGVPTVMGDDVKLTYDGNSFTIDGYKIVTSDVVATNGVLHVIDTVLVPKAARSFTQVLQQEELSEFTGFLIASDMHNELDKKENVTLFVPSNKAIANIDHDFAAELFGDKERLRDVIKYHMADAPSGGSRSGDLVSSSLPGSNIRINVYRQSLPSAETVTAQCAHVVKKNIATCAGVIHVIDRLLLPPAGNLMDLLSSNETFSIMTRLLQETGLADELSKSGKSYTVFAATDDAWNEIQTDTLNEIMTDKQKARELLKSHILPETLCCSGVHRDIFFGNVRYHTLGGNRHTIRRARNGQIRVGDVPVDVCDLTTTNGVVHLIRHVILPNHLRRHTYKGGHAFEIFPGLQILLGASRN